MKLYNTLSRKLEEFKPLADKTVKLYTCGPTVYDYLHVGNWVIFIRWDLLARTLRALGYHPNWVMNITDVGHLVSDSDEGEDKLEKGAKREGKTAWEVADFYTQDFLQGLRALNISISTAQLPKATDHISEQISLIKRLEEKGYTYKIDDGIYFDTSKLHDYGKLANLDKEGLKAGARVTQNPQKKNQTDFALWKFSPKSTKRDMEWDSPWGKGFPGWHIECSAFVLKYLGETIDIHGGGEDHIPIHHTNEIAQSESATGKPLAKYWLHGSFLTVNGTKISKSLANGFSLNDIAEHGFSPMDFRMLALQSHYRTHADFSWEALSAAQNRLKSLQAMADLRFQPLKQSAITQGMLKDAKDHILDHLSEDLNTPEALAALSSLEAQIENSGISEELLPEFTDFVRWLDEIFGLRLTASEDILASQKQLLKNRQTARDNQDWTKADSIRDQLAQEAIAVRDTPRGQIWYRL